MNPAADLKLTLRPPPRYGRRAVWAALAAIGLFGLAFGFDAAVANQVGASDMPAAWARYLAGVALSYAAICVFRWFRRRHVNENAAKYPDEP